MEHEPYLIAAIAAYASDRNRAIVQHMYEVSHCDSGDEQSETSSVHLMEQAWPSAKKEG